MVLDIGLPGFDGFSVCSKNRETTNTHILIASVKTDKEKAVDTDALAVYQDE